MVSVIVPVYNVEPYLRECLDSIITQSYTDLQIIIIDDGSTDGSAAICDAYAAKDTRIQVIHQENRGLSAARNRGIELASGRYLTFVDSDDYLLPDFVETLLNLCLEYDADMSVSSYTILENGRFTPLKIRSFHPEPELFVGQQKMEAYLKHIKLSVCAWGKLYAAELFRNIRYPEGKIHEDSAVFHLVVHAAKRIAYVSKHAYIYRLRPGSITTSAFSPQSLDSISSRFELIDFISSNYPSLLPYAKVRLVDAACRCFCKIFESGRRFPDIESQLQTLCRKNLIVHFKYSTSCRSRIFVLLVCINQSLAKWALRFYHGISRR